MSTTTKEKPGHYLTIYLLKALYQRFKLEARTRNVTVGKIVRECLEKEGGNITGFDAFSDSIGAAASGVVDLATKPKYLDGYGKS